MRNLLPQVGISGDDRGDWIGAVNEFRKRVPWRVRIGAKIVLARLPVPYRIWKQLRVFEHGDMNEPGRALDTFLEHARTAGVLNDAGPVRARALNAIFREGYAMNGFDVVLRRKG